MYTFWTVQFKQNVNRNPRLIQSAPRDCGAKMLVIGNFSEGFVEAFIDIHWRCECLWEIKKQLRERKNMKNSLETWEECIQRQIKMQLWGNEQPKNIHRKEVKNMSHSKKCVYLWKPTLSSFTSRNRFKCGNCLPFLFYLFIYLFLERVGELAGFPFKNQVFVCAIKPKEIKTECV